MLAHGNVVASIESFHRIVPPMEHRIVSLLPLSHLLEQAVGLYYALSVGADILYVRSRNPRVIFDALRDHRVTSMVVVPQVLDLFWSAIEREVAKRGRETAFDRLRAHRPAPPDGAPAAPVREHPQAARRPFPALPVGRRVPAAGAPAGLGGPRRDGPAGLRRDRDGDRQLHAARRPRSRARSDGRRTASRCGSPTTARSSSAARPSSAATGTTRPRPPPRSPPTAGTGPATSAISTRPAGSSCRAGSRTSSSCPTGSTSIRRTSRTRCGSPGSAIRSCSRRAPVGSRRSSSARRRGRPGVVGGDPTRPVVRDRIDAAVKAANATLGPNQRIAGWRLWPDEDFPRTHTLKIKRDPGARLAGGRIAAADSLSARTPVGELAVSSRPGTRPRASRAQPGSPAPTDPAPHRAATVQDDRRADLADDRDRALRRLDAARAAPEIGLLLCRGGGGPVRIAELVDDDVALVRILRQDHLVDGARGGRQQRRFGQPDGRLGVGQAAGLRCRAPRPARRASGRRSARPS